MLQFLTLAERHIVLLRQVSGNSAQALNIPTATTAFRTYSKGSAVSTGALIKRVVDNLPAHSRDFSRELAGRILSGKNQQEC